MLFTGYHNKSGVMRKERKVNVWILIKEIM